MRRARRASRTRHPATLINDEPPCTSQPVCHEDQPVHAHWVLIGRTAYDTHLRHVAPYAHTCSRSPLIPGAVRPSSSSALFERIADVDDPIDVCGIKRSYQRDDASSSRATFYSIPFIPPLRSPFHPRPFLSPLLLSACPIIARCHSRPSSSSLERK
jgi:hypothetical protein